MNISSMGMTPETRKSEILSLLRAMQTELKVDDLSRMLKVSALTIRRDLDDLSADALVIRTHGGCIWAGRAALENEYRAKVALNFGLKQSIGRAAAAEVQPGAVILINDGSTTYHVAGFLEGRGPLTVYTNSLGMLADLARDPATAVYLLGGRYRGEQHSLQGGLTEQALESLRFDLCFIGADAVSPAGQCMVGTPEEAGMVRAMLRRSTRRVLLCDHTKVGERGHFAYGSLGDFNLWISTPGMPADARETLSRMVAIKEAQA
jgi:DeoR/GlpR family transcriptional regulator of sugar metabolism